MVEIRINTSWGGVARVRSGTDKTCVRQRAAFWTVRLIYMHWYLSAVKTRRFHLESVWWRTLGDNETGGPPECYQLTSADTTEAVFRGRSQLSTCWLPTRVINWWSYLLDSVGTIARTIPCISPRWICCVSSWRDFVWSKPSYCGCHGNLSSVWLVLCWGPFVFVQMHMAVRVVIPMWICWESQWWMTRNSERVLQLLNYSVCCHPICTCVYAYAALPVCAADWFQVSEQNGKDYQPIKPFKNHSF